MKRATLDEATELSSARRGGATECGAAAEGEGVMAVGGPFVQQGGFGARGQGLA
jgi:hypothetical protein